MFRCHECGETKRQGRMVVYRTRDREYTAVDEYNRVFVQGRGWEIAEEHRVCSDCIEDAGAERDPTAAEEILDDILSRQEYFQ